MDGRTPVLYLAPWVDIGGADKGTIDWFRFLDRDRFRPSLITTQPSPNRRLAEIAPYADELWDLPQLMRGDDFPRFILTFLHSRAIRIVHLMNSRLGFELLPEIAALPDRPRVVVQLHVEEPDRAGYVRYVTTRYGNLVDAFSVSTNDLNQRLDRYDIPTAKRRVIPTGVDAEREFCPGRVEPIENLDPDRFQIVFAARLTGQKDPLLMVEIATRLREAGLRFQIHVLGDGELAPVLREEISARQLDREVIMHGDCLEVERWYAACDAALLTSAFEGLPYVAYEAMAMSVPVVAPQLPGFDDLVTSETGVLIWPRDDAQAYADALIALAGDPGRCKRIGELARSTVRSDHSLTRMASKHADLYEELLCGKSKPASPSASPTDSSIVEQPPARAFRGRRPGSSPLVTAIVPCFNHGLYLPDCLRSIAHQTYRPIETIVVDDGSTDPETLSLLARLKGRRGIDVVRLPENRGPAAARNAGIERAQGRYVLPVDSDNLLVPGAVADLVEQLGSAGEQIGFVYPNLQYFGNRLDYFEAPSFNLHVLLYHNYCDTAALFDREVFDRGLRYCEDIVLGHEDWDFVLTLAEHGIFGEPARGKTMLVRKVGFTRSDLVEACLRFDKVVAARHPRLFGAKSQIKGSWNPSITLIALDPISTSPGDAMPRLVAAAVSQTCADFELIVRTGSEVRPTQLGRRLRRIPSELDRSRAGALARAVAVARGRYVLATYGSPAALLADHALVEKVLRVMHSQEGSMALALAESAAVSTPFRLLSAEEAARATLGALCWTANGSAAPLPLLRLPSGRPLETLASSIVAQTRVQCRHLPRPDRQLIDGCDSDEDALLGEPRYTRPGDGMFNLAAPALPEGPSDHRGGSNERTWRPAQTRLLYRHLHPQSQRYVYTNSEYPPSGYELDLVLGALREFPLPGTVPLVGAGQQGPLRLGSSVSPDDPEFLGFVEQVPLPLLDDLRWARHRRTGQEVLIAGPADPLAKAVEEPRTIGYIEPYPIHPRDLPHVDVSLGLVGLVRTVDVDARRHRYGVGHIPAGMPAGELGALFTAPAADREGLWIDDEGSVFGAQTTLSDGRPSLRSAVRWTAAPLTWNDFGRWGPKLRASARRAYDSTRLLTWEHSNRATPPSNPSGYLLRSATIRSVPLYAAIHPVTGDQLLSHTSVEPNSLGYRHITLLGYLVAEAPVTGELGGIRVGVPWASRFGVVP